MQGTVLSAELMQGNTRLHVLFMGFPKIDAWLLEATESRVIWMSGLIFQDCFYFIKNIYDIKDCGLQQQQQNEVLIILLVNTVVVVEMESYCSQLKITLYSFQGKN